MMIIYYPQMGKPTGSNDDESVSVSVALRWSVDMYTESILSFCNNIRTKDGGTHVDGLKACLTRAINQAIKRRRHQDTTNKHENIPGEFIREGLTAIVSVSRI